MCTVGGSGSLIKKIVANIVLDLRNIVVKYQGETFVATAGFNSVCLIHGIQTMGGEFGSTSGMALCQRPWTLTKSVRQTYMQACS